MKDILEVTKTSRNMVSKLIQGFTLEQLNKVPVGFNNNLIWNVAHIVVTQQILVYKLADLPMMISDDLVEKYKKGTKPEQDVTQEEVDEIMLLLHKTIEKTETDSDSNLLQKYTEYPTSTGYVIKTNTDSMSFNNFHEALHIGVIMAIRKLV
ncbi:MAG: DinB family protein [Flavobacterium sp.]